jgi:hypothetical protein
MYLMVKKMEKKLYTFTQGYTKNNIPKQHSTMHQLLM